MSRPSWVYLFLAAIFFCIGFFFFLIKKGFLVVRLSIPGARSVQYQDSTVRREMRFFHGDGDRFEDHRQTLLWSRSDHQENLKLLIQTWLQIAQGEQLIASTVGLQNLFYSADGREAYLSFNQIFLDKEWSIQKKMFFIEGLLKTIVSAQIPIRYIVFLVNYRHMQDEHLDFSSAWPIDGFLG